MSVTVCGKQAHKPLGNREGRAMHLIHKPGDLPLHRPSDGRNNWTERNFRAGDNLSRAVVIDILI